MRSERSDCAPVEPSGARSHEEAHDQTPSIYCAELPDSVDIIMVNLDHLYVPLPEDPSKRMRQSVNFDQLALKFAVGWHPGEVPDTLGTSAVLLLPLVRTHLAGLHGRVARVRHLLRGPRELVETTSKGHLCSVLLAATSVCQLLGEVPCVQQMVYEAADSCVNSVRDNQAAPADRQGLTGAGTKTGKPHWKGQGSLGWTASRCQPASVCSKLALPIPGETF